MTNSAKPVPGAWMFAWNQGLFAMPSVWSRPSQLNLCRFLLLAFWVGLAKPDSIPLTDAPTCMERQDRSEVSNRRLL